MLTSSLDNSIIGFVSSRASDEDLGPDHIYIFQDASGKPAAIPNAIFPPTASKALSITVVDRTADLTRAAEALVVARFSFGGRSPHALDVVLVNEFVKKPFLVALTAASVNFTGATSDSTGSISAGADSLPDADGSGLSLVSSAGKGKIWDVTKRCGALLLKRPWLVFIHIS